jgi:multidrug resistance efflux pump
MGVSAMKTTSAGKGTRAIVTIAVILIAVVLVLWKWWDYVTNPWTRNGQVMAQVIQITPRVYGTIVNLPIKDNQFVKAGDLLFEIDPRTYQSTVDGLHANLDMVRDEIDALAAQVEATAASIERYDALIRYFEQKVKGKSARLEDYQRELRRYTRLVKTGAASQERLDQAEADVIDAQAVVDGAVQELLQAEAARSEAVADLARDKATLGADGYLNARLRRAKAQLHSAELQLEFTRVVAPVDGYVTNLNLRLGDHATANKAALALVDVNSYWVYGFFKESAIGQVRAGDRAIVTLMSFPDKPVEGRVVSRGWGVFQKDGATAQELLPAINATFEWIRLAQRVPVRVELGELPEGVELVVGTTATVLVETGTAGTAGQASLTAAPRALQ